MTIATLGRHEGGADNGSSTHDLPDAMRRVHIRTFSCIVADAALDVAFRHLGRLIKAVLGGVPISVSGRHC